MDDGEIVRSTHSAPLYNTAHGFIIEKFYMHVLDSLSLSVDDDVSLFL